MAITMKFFRETSLKCWTMYAWGCSTMVDHSPSHPKVEGLSPATTSGTKVKMAKSWNCNYFISLHLHSTCINKQGHTVNNLVELKLVKLWVSLSHWTYAQIIFPTSFADQKGGGLNKVATLAKYSKNTRQLLFYICSTNSNFDHLCPYVNVYL